MILQNGKRIDGCSDTVPVGTLQPYLGLVPPKGYLVCQGQLVSKITYSKLYEICGDTFGTSTETHFYLPDLRGKTLAGYDENDTAMNTIGKLLGDKTHVHSTGNHTLTVAEMPAHGHYGWWRQVNGTGSEYVAGLSDSYEGIANARVASDNGGGEAHNHGNTDEVTNYQPTITVNWIVKAVMLIPDYIIVEDKLTSDSAVDALSARQGKLLNEKFADYLTASEIGIRYLSTQGGTVSGKTNIEYSGVVDATEVPIWSNAHLVIGTTVTDGSITRCPSVGFVEYQNADGVLYMKDRALFWASSNNNMGHIPAANTGYEIIHTGNKYDVIGVNWTNNKEVRTLDSIDGKPIYKKYVEGNFNGTSNVTLATGVDKYLDAQITVLRESATQWHRANAHVMPHTGGDSIPEHIDCIFQQGDKIRTYCTNPTFTTAAFRGFIYYTKL